MEIQIDGNNTQYEQLIFSLIFFLMLSLIFSLTFSLRPSLTQRLPRQLLPSTLRLFSVYNNNIEVYSYIFLEVLMGCKQ